VANQEERDRLRAEIDFGDLGPGFETRRPEPIVGHASADLEANLRSVVGNPSLPVESYRLRAWAAASVRRTLRGVLDGGELVATTEADPTMIIRSSRENAEALCEAFRSAKLWGEAITFEEVGNVAVRAWGGERVGFSYVVTASAGPYIVLMEGDREVVEAIVKDRLGALRLLADADATS
jgi:hypothetical protein